MPGKGIGEAARNAASNRAVQATAGAGAAAVAGKKAVESTGGDVQPDPATSTEPASDPSWIDTAAGFVMAEPWVLVGVVALVVLGAAVIWSDD